MKICLPLIAIAVSLVSLGAAWAQEEPAPSAKNAPAALVRALPKGTFSLRWQQVSARPPVWAHLFCTPRGHSKEREQMFAEKRTGPVTRADISEGPSMSPSPFTLDIYERQEESEVGWKRLSRARFTQTKGVQEIHTRYLDPGGRRFPVLVMHFGYTHWHEWEVFTYARGWGSAPSHQTFPFGGEGESYVYQKFNRTERGRLVVDEEDGENGRISRGVYRWNGREWVDSTQKWLVIGATSPFKAAVQAVLAKRGYGEARRSDDFPRLRRGLWVWIAARYRSEKEAREHVALFAREGVRTYVRRAM